MIDEKMEEKLWNLIKYLGSDLDDGNKVWLTNKNDQNVWVLSEFFRSEQNTSLRSTSV